MKLFGIVLAALFLMNMPCFSGSNIITQQDAANASINIQVERWSVFQLNLKGTNKGNPFVDVVLSAEFINGDQIFHPNGFYDGNGKYRVRFMPTESGVWKYITKSNLKELDGIKGTITCIDPGQKNHGPVRVRNTFHLGYADGEPFWQIGTTCYAWVHQTEELQEQTLETLKSAPFNWLYIDYKSLKQVAEQQNLNCELVCEGTNYNYLGTLSAQP
jgi:hypothetical protein